MSRRSRRERGAPRSGARAVPAAPAPRPDWRAGGIAAVVLAILAVTFWVAPRRRTPVPEPPRETLSVTALIDSAVAAEGARDWPRVCHWLERLRATDPDNPSYKVALALGWHNLAWMGAPAGRERSATRTSLERIAAERRVLALLDSAAADATTPAEWAQALAYTGTAYKNMGLMTDALRVYTIVHMRAPGATPALTHAATLLAYLRDPQPRIAPSASPVLTEPGRP